MPDTALVYIVTPVHNGEKFLAECIESVLAQTHPSWQYAIVDNCSTDGTRDIARRYCARDSRIRLYENSEFLDIIENWNHAMRLMPPESNYCKVLHADDTLFAECLERMVEVAERDPCIAIVGGYVLQADRVVCDGLPYPRQVFSGAEVSRSRLRGETHVFGTPTTTLMRADVVRAREPFYDPSYLHADAAACLDILRERNWGYVHQVLSHTRLHQDSVTNQRANPLRSMPADNMRMLLEYGPFYFSAAEFQALLRRRLRRYYDELARHLLRSGDLRFIPHQRDRLAGTAAPFNGWRLARAVAWQVVRSPRSLLGLMRKTLLRQAGHRQAKAPRPALRTDLHHPSS